MKKWSLALFALFLTVPFLATGESAQPVGEEILFTPAEKELVDGPELHEVPGPETSVSEEFQALVPDEPEFCLVCNCYQFTC